MRLTSTLVLVLGVVAFAAPASADNGNGNGNGNGNAPASPGNSATAPGQVKKEEPVAAAQAEVAAAAAAPAPAVASAPATTAGVKPSNETEHDTRAPAASDRTKQYGNGHTAGEIAQKNGAAPQTILHGPGNSQPHKAAPCSGGHEVDVHALKAQNRRGHCGGSPSPPSSSGPSTAPHAPAPTTEPVAAKSPAKHSGVDPAKPAPQAKEPARQPGGRTARPRPSSREENAQGVLAQTRVAAKSELPFTGVDLRLVVLAALGLILLGAAIRTRGTRVESGHEHTNRARHAPRGAPAPIRGRARR